MEQTTYDEQIQEALELVEAQENLQEDNTKIEFSNGVVLKFKKVNILRIQAVMDKFEYPEVPLVPNEDKGRDERNPNDPGYQEAVRKVEYQRTMAVLDAIAAMGTEPFFIPDTVSRPEDQDWVEECQFIGVEVKEDSKLARYLAWVKYVAIVDAEDFMKIGNQFGVTLGISEARVAEQLRANFPDN